MPHLHPQVSMGLPTSIERSSRRPGCGCCAHCQCLGHCVEVDYSPNPAQALSPNQRSPLPSRATSPMPATNASNAAMPRKKDFLTVMENVPHPNDVVSLSRKTSRNHPAEGQPMTPAVPTRREAHSRSNSNNTGYNSHVNGSTPSTTDRVEREKERSHRPKEGKSSRPDSPNGGQTNRGNQQMQEDYEKGYSSQSKREHRRKESEIEIRTWAPSQEGEGDEHGRGGHRKDRNGSRKERIYDEEPSEERSRRKQQQQQQRDNGGKDNGEGEYGYEERKGRRGSDDREGENRARSKSRGREAGAQLAVDGHGNRGGAGAAVSKPDSVSISVGPITLTRTRSRNEAKADEGPEAPSFKAGKRELIKELIKSSAPIPVNAPSSFPHVAPNGVNPSVYNTSVTHVDAPRPIEVQNGEDTRFGSFNAIKKLTVHVASDYGLMLHFLDWSRRNELNEPLVAYRLEDGMQGAYEKKSGGHFFSKKQGMDWLQESHENGAKVKGRLSLGVGIRGPIVFHIDVKDKFVVSGTPDHAPSFKDDPHYGEHEDYRHIYFETPNGHTMKWYLAEPGRLMRLYGRGESDYGKLYAEARMQRADAKKNRGTKETQLFFYDPNHLDQPMSRSETGDEANKMDFAFLCASWWCARQTFDESRLVEAHAEVELIETIEKAFEVDLLAGA